MHRVIVYIFMFMLVGCESKTYTPQAVFTIEGAEAKSVEARKLLHEIAIDNNLMFEDGSHEFPSGTSTVMAVAERVDGLRVVLAGASEVGRLTVAVHCHEKCSEWQAIYKVVETRYSNKWATSE